MLRILRNLYVNYLYCARSPTTFETNAVGFPMRNTNNTKFANSETLAMIPNNFAAILNNV